MKKIVAMLLTAIMVIGLLAGCGGGGDTTTAAPEGGDTATKSADAGTCADQLSVVYRRYRSRTAAHDLMESECPV